MASKRSDTDVIISHLIVSGLLALVGRQLIGLSGALVGAALGVVVHQALDAPLADLIAEAT